MLARNLTFNPFGQKSRVKRVERCVNAFGTRLTVFPVCPDCEPMEVELRNPDNLPYTIGVEEGQVIVTNTAKKKTRPAEAAAQQTKPTYKLPEFLRNTILNAIPT